MASNNLIHKRNLIEYTMKSFLKRTESLTIFFFTVILLISCKDSDDDIHSGEIRLFTPENLIVSVKRDGLVLKWDKSPKADFYEIDLAQDKSFEPSELTRLVRGDSVTTAFENLEEETKYYIRIKGISKQYLDSKYYYGEATTGKMASYFKLPAYEDMSYTDITLKWAIEYMDDEGEIQPVIADQIILSSNEGEEKTVDITPEITGSGKLKIDGLKEGTSYTATMKNSGKTISKITFDIPSKPASAIEIDNTANLKQLIESAPDNAVIILKGGQIYDYSSDTINIIKNILIQGAPGSPRPIVYTHQFMLGGSSHTELTTTINTISFIHVELSGMKLNGGQEDPSVKPNEHAFGFYMRAADNKILFARNVTIESFSLNNCIIRNFYGAAIRNSIFNLHTSASIYFGEININNCMMFDLGRGATGGVQSFIHLNSNKNKNNIYCAKYILKNSTFYHLNTGLIEQRAPLPTRTEVPVVEISDCTFDKFAVKYPGVIYDTTTSSRNLFNFSGFTDTPINIKNCIFGEMKINNSLWLNKVAFSGATGIFINTYRAKEANFTDFGSNITNAGTVENIFPQRDEFNYTTSPEVAITGAGDPRWYNE